MPDLPETQAGIFVSVVIPTLNRESALRNTVAEILGAPSPYFLELIVIDQSNQLSELTDCGDGRLIYRNVDFKSLPRARNYGTAVARGEVILFLDDDVGCVTGVVEAHALAHIRSGASAVTGPVLEEGATLSSVDSLAAVQQAKLHTGELLIWDLDAEYSPLFAPGCNASYKREKLVELGGFDENFIGSSYGEDAEMSHRVKASGGTILFDPAASVVHLHAPMGGGRDDSYDLKLDETSVFNLHYFTHKIDRPDLMPKWFLCILRDQIFNRRAFARFPVSVLVRRTFVLLDSWRRARTRTRALLQLSK
jgi:GT2 family glycosyltransferase